MSDSALRVALLSSRTFLLSRRCDGGGEAASRGAENVIGAE